MSKEGFSDEEEFRDSERDPWELRMRKKFEKVFTKVDDYFGYKKYSTRKSLSFKKTIIDGKILQLNFQKINMKIKDPAISRLPGMLKDNKRDNIYSMVR